MRKSNMHARLIGFRFKSNNGDGDLKLGTLNNDIELKSINDYRLKLSQAKPFPKRYIDNIDIEKVDTQFLLLDVCPFISRTIRLV